MLVEKEVRLLHPILTSFSNIDIKLGVQSLMDSNDRGDISRNKMVYTKQGQK